jgi:ferric-dicitrate binding protein FerR (iron transport regulator)
MDYRQSLLKRFLRNECTERENNMVFHALRTGWIDEDFLKTIESVMNNPDTGEYIAKECPVPNEILDDLRKKIRSESMEKRPEIHRRRIPEWMKIAAMFIFFSLSWLFFHFKMIKGETEQTAAMNTITVPAGQTANLMLSDGTAIWLNSRTVMRYPDSFKDKQREIYLEGEAFFDVTHDQQKPFVVHTDGYDVRVFGTQFDVEAYSRDDFATSLLSGSVKLSSVNDTTQVLVLQPSTMAYLLDGNLVSGDIADYNHFRWREGLISIKDMSFNNLMKKFEKCYGIQIIVKNKHVENYVYTGKFRYSDGIDYALRVLQRDVRFTFFRDEEKHIIIIR